MANSTIYVNFHLHVPLCLNPNTSCIFFDCFDLGHLYLWPPSLNTLSPAHAFSVSWETWVQTIGIPLMLQLQAGFHDAELRHTERGLGDRVGKKYSADLPCARSVICTKNTQLCEASLSSGSLQSSERELYHPVECVMRAIRSGCPGNTEEPTRQNRG